METGVKIQMPILLATNLKKKKSQKRESENLGKY